MSKKIKIIIGVLTSVVLLVAGGVSLVKAEGGSAPSTEASTANVTGTNALLVKVAGILGIPADNLTNAFKQARLEIRDEAITKLLDKAAANGRITQGEANEIKGWWGQRPEVIDRLFPFGGKHIPALVKVSDNVTGAQALMTKVAGILGISEESLVNAFKQARQEMREEVFNKALDKAVGNGKLTQDQADKIREWVKQRPEGIGPGLFPRLGGKHMWGWSRGW